MIAAGFITGRQLNHMQCRPASAKVAAMMPEAWLEKGQVSEKAPQDATMHRQDSAIPQPCRIPAHHQAGKWR